MFKIAPGAAVGDASSEVSAASCRLRCEKDSETGVTAPRLLKLKQGLAEAGVLRPFPVTLAIARALPSCGVLTTAGYLSIPCRDLLPYDGLVLDNDGNRAVPVHKLTRAAARAQFAEVPEFPGSTRLSRRAVSTLWQFVRHQRPSRTRWQLLYYRELPGLAPRSTKSIAFAFLTPSS